MKTLISYLQLFPIILGAVKALEEALPLPSIGKQKLDLLLSIVEAAYNAEQSIQKEIPWTQIESVVKNAVSLIVTALNGMGLFKHPAAQASPSTVK